MKEIKTCEEYVLAELEEKKEQVKRLKEWGGDGRLPECRK